MGGEPESVGPRAERVDFFISHAGSDRAWAEWVAWQLTDAGYTVELDVWDWVDGRNFVTAMSDALDRCDRVVALFSAAYFDRPRYTTTEWSTAVLPVPGMDESKLISFRVEDVPVQQMPAVLRPLQYRDLFDLDASQARQILLEAVQGSGRPVQPPIFPGRLATGTLSRLGGSRPQPPGNLPRIWNVPARNPGFTGRDSLLVTVRLGLLDQDRAVVQALHGMGGVGKTQLAIEYAHRFAGTYDLVWWVAAEQASLIGEKFAALGARLRCVEAGAAAEAVRSAVLGELRVRGQWLLVFDNATNPDDLVDWLPGGSGHVLITSRERQWEDIAVPVEIDVLERAESIAILRGRVRELTEAEADRLAHQLGDLPLAVVQAAGYLTETGMSPGRYLQLLEARAKEILGQGRPVSYPRSLASAIHLTAEKVASDDPAAAELADLCAFLAPEPIPQDLFTSAAEHLPSSLVDRAANPMLWADTLAHLAKHRLTRIDHHSLQMHRLTQAILRDRLSRGLSAATRGRVEAILAANDPHDPINPRTWPKWAYLMPHVLAMDLAHTAHPDLREMACDGCVYLLARGDARSCHDLACTLFERWSQRLGSDDEHTLAAAHNRAWALRVMGSYAEARELDEDNLRRYRRSLGEDHPDTLTSASNLANDLRALGKAQDAYKLHQDTLRRRRRVLGEDHPDTLISANNVAADLRELGEQDDVEEARELDEDTLRRRRRVLRDDHPDTLISASNLAADLRELGRMQQARELDEDTLRRRRLVLGEDHPATLMSANNLAADLRGLRDPWTARELDEDTLNRRRRILGKDHPDTRKSAGNLAADRRALGETADEN